MSFYKSNLVDARLKALEEKLDKADGMVRRCYAFMKACERDNMLPKGWTVDNGNGGTSFRPAGSPSFAANGAALDHDLIRQARTYSMDPLSGRPVFTPEIKKRPRTPESNDNCADAGLEEERAALKRFKEDLAK